MLDAEAVVRIYARFKPGRDLEQDFEARFGVGLDREVFPRQHQIVIVAAELDASSEQIVSHLAARSIAINVLCFEVFEHGPEKLLSRAWLHDPLDSQVASTGGSLGEIICGATAISKRSMRGSFANRYRVQII